MLSKALLGFSVPDKQPGMTAHYNPDSTLDPDPIASLHLHLVLLGQVRVDGKLNLRVQVRVR